MEHITNSVYWFSLMLLIIVFSIVFGISRFMEIKLFDLGRGVQLSGIFITALGFILVGLQNKVKNDPEFQNDKKIEWQLEKYIRMSKNNSKRIKFLGSEIGDFIQFTEFKDTHYKKMCEFYETAINPENNIQSESVISFLRDGLYQQFRSKLIMEPTMFNKVMGRSPLLVFGNDNNLNERKKEFDIIIDEIYKSGNFINQNRFDDLDSFFRALLNFQNQTEYVYSRIRTKKEKVFIYEEYLENNIHKIGVEKEVWENLLKREYPISKEE